MRIPWAALRAGDGVRAPDGTWHRVTRAEAGWIELDGTHAFPAPPGSVAGWSADVAMAGAVALVEARLGGRAVGHRH